MARIATVAATIVTASALAACGGHDAGTSPAAPTPTAPSSRTVTAGIPGNTASPSTEARAVLHPAFRWNSRDVTSTDVGKSWRPGCPVPTTSLRAVSVTYWGFDHAAHIGHLVVNVNAVRAIVAVMRSAYAVRFPVRKMVPIAAYGGDDNKSMAADNTSAFNCRAAVAAGAAHWSMHAYGQAIDVDPLENPYTLNGRVYPPNGKPYTDRSNVRPGMAVPGNALVRAFDAVGWGWGGRWPSSPDYQHFSSNGR